MKGKKLTAILLTVVLALGIVFAVPFTASATTKTQSQAISWVKSQLGKAVDYDGGNGAQCVDLIFAYYDYLGVPVVYGSAYEFITNKLPTGWKRVEGGVPQKGDILIYAPTARNPVGHVAIYESDTSSYHQNANGCMYVINIPVKYNYEGYSNPYWGYIRPNWSTITATPTTATTTPKPTTNTTASTALSKTTVSVGNVSNGLKLTWNKSANADGYYIYRKTVNGSYRKIATVKGANNTSYIDKAVSKYQGYGFIYAVRAYKGSKQSTYSARLYYRLQTPKITTARNVATNRIQLNWNKQGAISGHVAAVKYNGQLYSYNIRGSKYTGVYLSGLSRGKTYTPYVRTYRTVGGKNYYSAWASAKAVKITK